jgi:hypothetical protein
MRSTLPLFVLTFAVSAPVLATEAVPVPEFRSVQLRGGGNVTVVPGPVQRVTILEGSSRITGMRVDNDGKLRIDACNERCPRVYKLRIEVQSPRVPDLAVSGGGAIATSGGFRAQAQLSAAVNGGGRIDARALEAQHVSAAVNGGGEILVRPRASLSAAVNGGGSVRYWGNPAVSMAVRGGGAVTRGY